MMKSPLTTEGEEEGKEGQTGTYRVTDELLQQLFSHQDIKVSSQVFVSQGSLCSEVRGDEEEEVWRLGG
ncbi:hypothetical protein EYF80_028700 [Liparis tanakae]|uniref:Uncharacterized protein n=1 Tax=Liparis tanakae TaxID=230148 RepID=A0A4Z2H5B1_9TELE|nr:hypothetical protein EYF80_028700 [Liparis tanakae]